MAMIPYPFLHMHTDGKVSGSGKTWPYTVSASLFNSWLSTNLPKGATIGTVTLKVDLVKTQSLGYGYVTITVAGSTLVSDHRVTSTQLQLSTGISSYITSNSLKGDIVFSFRCNNNVTFTMENAYIEVNYTECSHSYTSSVTKHPTCTEKGVKTYTCTRCGATYTEEIPSNGHTWVNATCTTPKKCSVCGATEGSALGHKWEIMPTCTDPYICSVCGARTGEPLGHNYIKGDPVPPTDSSYGYTKYTCSRCGDSYETDFVYRIKVEASPPEGGTVSGGGDYNAGDSVTVSAQSNTGWYTSEWLKNGVHCFDEHTGQYTFKASESIAYTIIFRKLSYVLTLNAENGTITGATNGASYDYGTSLTLKAVPDTGYKFVGWSDGVTDDTRTITITDQGYLNTYTAIFEKLPPQITSVTITRSSDLAQVTINTPVDAEKKFIISVEVI